jgi:glycosyltransferase involved in cell wall biosynthesis
MKNITILHYAAPPIIGGVESVIGHHARLMVTAGHRVTIIAGRGEQTREDIPFISIPLVDSRQPQILAVKGKLDGGTIPQEFEQLVDELASILEDHLKGMDILIAHNVCSLNKNLILTTALKRLTSQTRMPHTILWHHDLAWTTPRYRDELHDGYPWDLLRTDWPEVIQVTVSEARRLELYHVSPERIKVIPNGIDLDRFLKLEKMTQALIKKHDLLSASPLLLLPVRITSRKNIELAINALAYLQKDFPQATLIVTGPLGAHNAANQAYHDALTNLRDSLGLNKAVIFLADETNEYIPDEVIADFYQMADALFLPSREEGFGIPVIEAGLSGLPIFCSDIPPLRHLGGELVTYFSPDEDPSVLAGKIYNRCAGDSVFNLRRKIKSQYIWDRIFSEQIQPLLEGTKG